MQVSVLAGTVFQDTHLPLTVWFRAMWHITSQKNGVSALGLQRALGLGSYKTAWLILHKLRQAMVRPGRERLQGVVEVDETYWGAAESGGATGRLVYSKALIVVAAEQDGKGIGRIRMGTNPRFRSRNASWLYPIVGRNREHSLHRWAQFLPRDERLYPPPARSASAQGWGTLTAQSPPSGLSAQAMDARNPSGSYRLPTPRRLPQRIRLPFQPAKVGLARQTLLPVGTARSPGRPNDLRKTGAATRY